MALPSGSQFSSQCDVVYDYILFIGYRRIIFGANYFGGIKLAVQKPIFITFLSVTSNILFSFVEMWNFCLESFSEGGFEQSG